MKTENGVAHLFVMIVAGSLLVVLLALFIYFQKTSQIIKTRKPSDAYKVTQEVDTTEEIPISDSDKTIDIEKELNSTSVGSFDQDIEALESDASSL